MGPWSESEMEAFEAYERACLAYVASWSDRLGPDAVEWSIHLINHSEAPIGLTYLAGRIDEAGLIATADEVHELLDLTAGMEPEEDLPDQFRR